MALSRPLLSRLHHDLTELHDSPYPGVTVFTDDANIRKLCLILTPPSGPSTDLSLHFDVLLPENWPASPPKVSSSVSDIEHPNLFGTWICCDLLKEQSQLRKGYSGGYTPALTLRGLFLQFLTFFSSTKIEQQYGGIIDIGDHLCINYIRERDIVGRLIPGNNCCQHNLCRCGVARNVQGHLERYWDADISPETVISSYATDSGPVVQKVKQTISDPARIHKFEGRDPKWHSTHALISKWQCSKCPYGSDDFPHHRVVLTESVSLFSKSPLSTPPQKCLLGMLNDDVLLEVASRTPSESLISFTAAYSRLHTIVNSMHVLMRRELRCFFLRTPFQESVLGIGVALDPGPRLLSSDFDWLSEDAFNYGIRRSVEKREFQFFLPLAFSRVHFERAQGKIWDRQNIINQAVRDADVVARNKYGRHSGRQSGRSRRPERTEGSARDRHPIDAIFKMMNNIVVALMKSCESVLAAPEHQRSSHGTLLLASEKAVISYCHLFHLLICICRTNVQIRDEVATRLKNFIEAPAVRTKECTPDLGELLILVTLIIVLSLPKSTSVTWANISGPFLEEAIIRNVRWVLKETPDLEFLEEGFSDYRLKATFRGSHTSLQLLMFQVSFLTLFTATYASDISRLDDNYGFAERGLAEHMVEEIKEIYGVSNWVGFFERIQFARGVAWGKDKFCALLRRAVVLSGERGYHTPAERRVIELLGRKREASKIK